MIILHVKVSKKLHRLNMKMNINHIGKQDLICEFSTSVFSKINFFCEKNVLHMFYLFFLHVKLLSIIKNKLFVFNQKIANFICT